MAKRGRPRGSGTAKASTASVQTLDRALSLLVTLAAADGLTLTALGERTGLAPSSLHRLLASLSAHGFVAADEVDQTWAIGVEAFRVGQAFLRRAKAVSVARPVMRDLMEETGETANLGLIEGGEVVFVAQVESAEPIRAFFRAGERRAAHASGIGKALIAEWPAERVVRLVRSRGLERYTANTLTGEAALMSALAEIRARGFAIDDEERNAGMRCIAAAIFDENGEAAAGLSISGPSARLDAARLAALGPRVAAAAARITAAIGGVVPRCGSD